MSGSLECAYKAWLAVLIPFTGVRLHELAAALVLENAALVLEQ